MATIENFPIELIKNKTKIYLIYDNIAYTKPR